MFRNDQRQRVALRYPTRPVRLGQVPLAAQYPNNFLGYLRDSLGFSGPYYVEALGGAPGTPGIAYSIFHYAPSDPSGGGQELPYEDRIVPAAEADQLLARWQAGQGTVVVTPRPYTTPIEGPPLAPGVDLAQITRVQLPSASMPAGAQFTLQVTVLNAGTVTWTTGYTIVLQAPPGTPTSAPQSFATLPSALPPGASATVTLTAWAPTQPGTYAYAVGLYTPTSQAISPLVTVGLIVTTATTGSSVVPTAPAGYVSQHEFGSYVQAMLASQREIQGAVAGMQAGAAQAYSPTYIGQPGPPGVSPADAEAGARPVVIQPAVVASAGLFGLPWWFWLLSAAALGGGIYYVYYRPAARRRRAGGQAVGQTMVTAPQARSGPPRRRRLARRRPR